jgi:hypothetical protein
VCGDQEGVMSTLFDPRTVKVKDERRDNLSISLDYDTDREKTYPVLLFTPDIEKTADHHHITLSREQAQLLHQWLSEYLSTLY